MIKAIVQLLKEEEGQSMVEYGIILALISVVAIGVVQAVASGGVEGHQIVPLDVPLDVPLPLFTGQSGGIEAKNSPTVGIA